MKMTKLIKDLAKNLLKLFNIKLSKIENEARGNILFLEKAKNFQERFKDAISDPLNLLIERVPEAGYMDDDLNIILHNGNRVPSDGKYSYYGNFSELLILNRGVHEPIEEYCFQEVLKHIDSINPIMIELGAYWAHYSMWFQKYFPNGHSILVESDMHNLKCGEFNFRLNGFSGNFINQEVAKNHFEVDKYLAANKINILEILHSDIQGFELEMLECASNSLNNKQINYIFVSTHSEKLHSDVYKLLESHGYRIEVSSNFESHTTSFDGFILATNPNIASVFKNFNPLGRVEILHASPRALINSIQDVC